MIDLFGLGRAPQEPQEPPPEGAPEAETHAAPRGSYRVWAFLLVLDALFVVVFGGTVVVKVFQHLPAPSARPAPEAARRPEPKPVKAPEPAPVPPAPEKAAATAPKPAPKPSAAAPRGAQSARVPKPALATPLKPRGTPEPEVVGRQADDQRARPVTFRLHVPHAREVQLVGAFIVHGGRMDMAKKSGLWTVLVYLKPGRYRYFFFVDKKKALDPENPRSDRGASLLDVP